MGCLANKHGTVFVYIDTYLSLECFWKNSGMGLDRVLLLGIARSFRICWDLAQPLVYLRYHPGAENRKAAFLAAPEPTGVEEQTLPGFGVKPDFQGP